MDVNHLASFRRSFVNPEGLPLLDSQRYSVENRIVAETDQCKGRDQTRAPDRRGMVLVHELAIPPAHYYLIEAQPVNTRVTESQPWPSDNGSQYGYSQHPTRC